MALAWYPRSELAAEANVAPEGSGFGGVTLAYNTRDRKEVDALLAEAEKAGAKLLKPAQETFGAAIQDTFRIPTEFCGRSPGTLSFGSQKVEASGLLSSL